MHNKQPTVLPLALLVLCCLLAACGNNSETTRFQRLDPSVTGVDFVNETGENDSFNILTNEYIYNGGGVGIGDFNQDGRPDIFFSGNDPGNRLYLNEGDWKFKDITPTAGVAGADRWSGGVTVVDVNEDGLDDIYVCASVRLNAALRANQLFINQGLNPEGIPVFEDLAPAYGLADTSHNTQAAWLDFDLDGDLDVYLLVNKMVDSREPNIFTNKITDGSGERTDKLYRQDRDEAGNIHFVEVGKEHGILFQGFGLGVTVCDLNRDGRPDLYVTNDYLSNDLVYLNTVDENGKVWFKDIAADLMKHTSFSAMGNDVADLNNDGLPDILAVDMLPADNLRRKMMMPANNYTNFINNQRFGYAPQYARNTLQMSQGHRPDSSELPLYSEVSMSAGIPATDWSWTPLVADFDLDGYRDVIITNGFPRDITDHDFGDYQVETSRYLSLPDILPLIPSVKIPNEAFRAKPGADGFPIYEKVSKAWGIDVTSFSNGAAYADLDGDGDLDYVVNNLQDPAHLYRNDFRRAEATAPQPGFIKLKPHPSVKSSQWMGSEVTVTTSNGRTQTAYWHPHRGYLSSHGTELIFGLGDVDTTATVSIKWANGNRQTIGSLAAGETKVINPLDYSAWTPSKEATVKSLLTSTEVPGFMHQERDFIDFNVQPMLLRKLSQQGPFLAVSDLNKDGYEDLYVSGSFERSGYFLFGGPEGFGPQSSKATNEEQSKQAGIPAAEMIKGYSSQPEEMGCLFFDADGDGDDDLYVVSGSYELKLDKGDYQDRFYRNDGQKFVAEPNALIDLPIFSGSVVKAVDYDQDGDLDLFVGGRVVPHAYPLPLASYFLRNDTQNGQIKFSVDENAGRGIASLTNVTDALFSDYDNDGRPDLLVAGEWAPLRLFRNTPDGWQESTTGLEQQQGWWSALTAGDFDQDGDLDYVAGNFGTNSILRADEEHPIQAYLVDLDLNGALDFIPSVWFPNEAGALQRFPYFNRSDFAKQLNGVKARHQRHIDFARADAKTYELTEEQTVENKPYHFQANFLQHAYLENTPDGFIMRPLPPTAQTFPVFGLETADLNQDGHLDILMVGNDWGNEVGQGAMDAGNGLVLLGDGKGNFRPLTSEQSGLYVPGEGRSLVRVKTPDGVRFVAGQNRGGLVVLE